jgi:hypothetical protein
LTEGYAAGKEAEQKNGDPLFQVAIRHLGNLDILGSRPEYIKLLCLARL